ncbi:hypothetical protein [Streptomyces sp. NPDC058751]|uniref:hypothetical protein n=1 Tax=Streptomyces sp. NPDC058751 TaxID=3346623 RepID=UPI0036A46F85
MSSGRQALQAAGGLGEDVVPLAEGEPDLAAAAAHCASATTALLRGYADGPGPLPASVGLDAVARSAVLRMFTHCLDYAAFVGWDDRLTDHLDVLAALLDHPMGTIDGLTGAPAAPDVALETERP